MRREIIKVFVGTSRPSHDSAPFAAANMTDSEQRTLRNRISRYMQQCNHRDAQEKLRAVKRRGDD